MSYTFEQNLVPASNYKFKCPYEMVPDGIVIHNTANDASADNEIKYMVRNGNYVSYHVAIDDKKVIQGIPFNRNAFHTGDGTGVKSGNRTKIGIEICYSKSGGTRYIQAEENTVQYVAKLLKERGWGVERVTKHQDYSGKYCPHRILSEGRWDSFKQRIQKALDELNDKDKKKEEPEMPQQFLNTTGRAECKEMIRRGVSEKLFHDKHEDMENYTDTQLISYAMAYQNRKLKALDK